MSIAAFSATVAPLTPPMLAAPQDDIHATLKPFILIGAVAFMVGFGGYLMLKGPRASVAPDRAPTAAVSTAAATLLTDVANPPTPV